LNVSSARKTTRTALRTEPGSHRAHRSARLGEEVGEADLS
jgi:hypothetical protein